MRQTDQQHCRANDGFQEGHPWPAMPRKAVSKDTTSKVISIMNEAMPMKLVSKDTTDQAVPMMDVSKDTTNQAMFKMIIKLTNYKEETTAGTKPGCDNEEQRPSLLCIGFNNKTKVLNKVRLFLVLF